MKRVLIVDDSSFVRLSLKNILEKNNFQVVGEADNGLKAIQKYAELKPDIVTMDITMPDMDGIEATAKIREIDGNAKIIVLSAMGQEAFVRRAIMSGASGFVVKPFKENFVVNSLNSL